MKRNVFSILLFLVGLLFAALSIGGCGGSSSNLSSSIQEGGNPNGEVVDDAGLSMCDVWNNGEALDEVSARLTSEDIIKMIVLRTEEIVREDDGSITMQHFDVLRSILSDEEYPKIPYNKDELLAHYNSEDIIIIHKPDQELVNTVRSDLGLSGEDAGTFGQSGSLEVYGLACIKTDGLRNLFVYVVPKMGDITASNDSSSEDFNIEPVSVSNNIDLPEIASEDIVTSEDNAEVVQEEYTMRDFQLDRWANFFKWMGDLAVEAAKNYNFASSYKVQAADDELDIEIDIAAVCDAQSRTFDFSYANIHADGPRFDGEHYSCTEFMRTRNNFVSVKIFAIHSFNNGKDYYVVENTTRTEPKNFANKEFTSTEVRYCNYLYGFTDFVATDFYINDGDISPSDVKLREHVPDIKEITGTYRRPALAWVLDLYEPDESDTISQDLWDYELFIEWLKRFADNNKFGVKKDGTSAKVNGLARYLLPKEQWTVNEYTIEDRSKMYWPESAAWHIDVNKPSDGEYSDGVFVYYKLVNAAAASTNPLQYDSYFMWEVGRDYWKNHPEMNMNLIFGVGDGICVGQHQTVWWKYGRLDGRYITYKEASMTLEQPPHTAVDKTRFYFTEEGAASQSFTLLAEDSWELTAENILGQKITDWLHFHTTSGDATGDKDKQIVFDVDENPNAGARQAVVKIKSGRDTVEVNIMQLGYASIRR